MSDRTENRIPRALTIAGSDSCGGAGIQLDLKVFAALGVYGLSAVTAVTAQNTRGVKRIFKVAPKIVAAQIDAVMEDIGADACKIGMLYSHQNVVLIAGRIKRREIPRVVLDPVFLAKDGTPLLTKSAAKEMRETLFPLAELITPNVPEAEYLTGLSIDGAGDVLAAAQALKAMGPAWVMVKGGHLSGEPVDFLYDGRELIELHGTRSEGDPVHGTGCLLSAALAARMAHGDSVPDAARFAKDFTARAIQSARKLGGGARLVVSVR